MALVVSMGMVLAAPSAQAQSSDDVLTRAMHDELARSMDSLHLAQADRPYFIAYRVRDVRTLYAGASMGSLTSTAETHVRLLSVELRVGNYQLDNSKFFVMPRGFGSGRRSFGLTDLPVDDDYQQIRRAIWLATDAAYKQAVEAMAGKRAAMANQARPDTLPDFSKATPTQTVEDGGSTGMTLGDVDTLARALSAEPSLAGLFSSGVRIEVFETRTRYMNSEGTSLVESRPFVSVFANGSTQAADGMPLQADWHVYAHDGHTLPSRSEMLGRLHAMAMQLDSIRQAPLLDRYNGPVLFEGAAAGEIFSANVGRLFLAQRQAASRVGSRVLPNALSVVDDPTVATYGKEPLFGTYKVDDDGVPGSPHVVVDSGILKAVLTTRTPIEDALQSTGNHRGGGAVSSNVIVKSTSTLSDQDMKAQLLALVKQRGLPFGIVIREVGGENAQLLEMLSMLSNMEGERGIPVGIAYKVFPDGHEEIVRGGRLSGISPESFKNLTAVSQTEVVYTTTARPAGFDLDTPGAMGASNLAPPLTTYVVPALLFDDVAMPKATGQQPKPPYSDPPNG